MDRTMRIPDPTGPGAQGTALSAEIDHRIGSLLAEAETRRLATGARHDGLRRRLGRALVAAGRSIEGRTPVEPAVTRPGQPAASARA
jgi:hypothetical protein